MTNWNNFNLNDRIRFKLTSYGQQYLLKKSEIDCKRFGSKVEYDKIFVVDKDGYCETELWHFALHFGDSLWMGNTKCPVEMNVQIKRDFVSSSEETAKWLSDFDKCDICRSPVKGVVEFFYDGKTKEGPWALMCPSCFEKSGTKIGYGSAQKYDGTTGVLLEGGFC